MVLKNILVFKNTTLRETQICLKDIFSVHLHTREMHIVMIEQLIWFSIAVEVAGQNRHIQMYENENTRGVY